MVIGFYRRFVRLPVRLRIHNVSVAILRSRFRANEWVLALIESVWELAFSRSVEKRFLGMRVAVADKLIELAEIW